MREGWKSIPLAKACTLFTDGDWIETKDQSLEGIRLIQTGNVGVGEYKDKESKARFISEATFSRLKCQEVFSGDCLVSRLPDPVGRSCIVPPTVSRLITSVDCTILRFSDSVLLPEFFNYYSQSAEYLNDVESHCTGATRKRISRSSLGKIDIPLPPIAEQKRIVAILDEACAGIATAIANTEKNLANARELFESYLSQLKGESKPLGDYVRITTGKLNANAAVENGEYPFFTCSRDISHIDHYAFDCEAILLAGNNASGDFNVKHYSGKFNAYQRTYVITIERNDDLAYRFLYFQLLRGLKQLKEGSVGAGTKFLKLDMIKNLRISVPSISRQHEFLRTLAILEEDVSRLISIYQEKLAALAELKQSLLQKAFSGELTAKSLPALEAA